MDEKHSSINPAKLKVSLKTDECFILREEICYEKFTYKIVHDIYNVFTYDSFSSNSGNYQAIV